MPIDKISVGKRISTRREELRLTQAALANRLGMDQAQLNGYESGKRSLGVKKIAAIAAKLDCSYDYLAFGTAADEPEHTKNPKPVALGAAALDSIFLMIGGHTEPMNLRPQYRNLTLEYPKELKDIRNELIRKATARANAGNHPFFEGPNTRLCRVYPDEPASRLAAITERDTRQMADGTEKRGVVLELGPVSWYDFTAMNTFLDDKDGADGGGWFPGEPGKTIRQKFTNNDKLFNNPKTLEWLQLSNILTVNVTPITSDGYAILQVRSPTGVSTGAGRYSTGVAENIHRYLDEADSPNFGIRKNPIDTARRVAEQLRSPVNYVPTGVPSPTLTALRGLYEEVSEQLYFDVHQRTDRVKFLNIFFDLEYYNPHLSGVIELSVTKSVAEKMITESHGKDHSEANRFEFVELQKTNSRVVELLGIQKRWAGPGLANFITAIQYWEARSR